MNDNRKFGWRDLLTILLARLAGGMGVIMLAYMWKNIMQN